MLALEVNREPLTFGFERQTLNVAIRMAADNRAGKLEEVLGAHETQLTQ